MNRTQKILSLARRQTEVNIQQEGENINAISESDHCKLNNLIETSKEYNDTERVNDNLETKSNFNTILGATFEIQNAPILFVNDNIIFEYNNILSENVDTSCLNNKFDDDIIVNEEVVDEEIQLEDSVRQKQVNGNDNENVCLDNEIFKVVPLRDNTENGFDNVEEEEVQFDNNRDIQENVANDDIDESSDIEIEQKLTKKGTKRKRRTYKSSLSTRKYRENEKRKSKHKVFTPCSKNCRKKCTQYFSEEERVCINETFWNLDYTARRVFIISNTVTKPIQRRRGSEDSSRQNTFEYYLKNKAVRMQVCKTFFLTTLGFSKNNNTVIHNVLRHGTDSPKPDGRGRHPKPKIDRAVLHAHVESFHPCISHYRREHAPNKRYLASDITIHSMYKDFIEKHNEFRCSYDLYRSILSEMNISFTKLGHEECESCEFFRLHDNNHCKENLVTDCEHCIKWKFHIDKANSARHKYREDAERIKNEKDVVYSADLQKVIMLPRMDTFKTALFTQRIIAFNETFAPVGKNQKKNPLAVVWHEAVAGRKKEELVSTFHHFFLSVRDSIKITLWLDNCSSQNKNWTLFSFLIYIINSTEISAEEIIINYFEPGHTFMSCDSFHHQVEQSMKRAGKVYDFNDFVNCVQNANSGNVSVKSMSPCDFSNWIDHSSQFKLKKAVPRPYLADMVQVVAERNKFELSYRTSFSEELKPLNFLSAKALKNKIKKPDAKQDYRGISQHKKDNILINLVKIMPLNRHNFWKTLPASSEVTDLITSLE